MQNKRGIIKYCFLAIMVAGILDSLFVGFSAFAYRIPVIIGTVALFLGVQALFYVVPKLFYVCFLMTGGFFLVAHKMIMNGFYLVSNIVTNQINHIFDMGFFYYIDTSIEHAHRDSIAFILLVVLIINLMVYVLRRRIGILLILCCLIEFIILILAPYDMKACFFIFLLGVFGFDFYRREQYQFCFSGCIILFICVVALWGGKGESIQELSFVKKSSMELLRNVSQGGDYVVSGGIGEGDLRKAQKIKPTNETLFTVETLSNETLYLKGFVSGDYEKNHWLNHRERSLLVNGNDAIALPYQFFDLHMSEYMMEKEETMVDDEEYLTIHYKKLNDQYYLWPYFGDIESNIGNVSGDKYLTRMNLPATISLTYYPIKSIEQLVKPKHSVKQMPMSNSIEANYITTMKEYNEKVKELYLDVPENLAQKLEDKYPWVKKRNSLEKQITYVQKLLSTYTYSYEQEQTPQEEDSIWFFLNDTKKGYCVSYASSAVMLFRMMGTPCRYVEGYKVDASTLKKKDKVAVSDRYAHAWPEVYVQNVGWVPVEVTNVSSTNVSVHVENKELQKTQYVQKWLQMLQIATNVWSILCYILFIVFLLIQLLQLFRWKKMTNKEKANYYYDSYLAKNDSEMAKIKDSKVENVLLKAKYSPYEITKEELNIIKRYVHILRKKL